MKYDGFSGTGFLAWQPSTWPAPPVSYTEDFQNTLKAIFHDSLLIEIENIITDAPSLVHRGHVVALSILCAIDTISSYAFRAEDIDRCQACGRADKVGPRYKKYIAGFFPGEYPRFADKIYHLYRNTLTHSWNLFEATMMAGHEPIEEVDGTIRLGLQNLFASFKISVDKYLEKLSRDSTLQAAALKRYSELKRTARP